MAKPINSGQVEVTADYDWKKCGAKIGQTIREFGMIGHVNGWCAVSTNKTKKRGAVRQKQSHEEMLNDLEENER